MEKIKIANTHYLISKVENMSNKEIKTIKILRKEIFVASYFTFEFS